MIIDGALYAAVAVFAALNTSFGSEEAAKYVSPEHLFWLKTNTGAIASGCLALKMFRSTTYAEHRTATVAEETAPAPVPVAAPQSQSIPPTVNTSPEI